MAGMFYSLKDVLAKLNKTEAEIAALVKQGRLREFRDGPNLLFKIDEVEALLSDTTFAAAQKPAEAKEEEVELLIEGDEEKPKSEADTTAVASEGINVLGETDSEISLTDDTLAATKASGATAIIEGALSGTKASGEPSLEEIEENVNLDTFGSGSGLLDLSLQADDTSLGGILDEIYTPEGEEGKEKAKESSAVELAAEADQITGQQEQKTATATAQAIPAEQAEVAVVATEDVAIEPGIDKTANMLGIMLFVPLLAVIYAIVVALAGQKEIASTILTLKGLTWPVIGGAALVAAILSGAAFMTGGKKAARVKKEKKSKKAKEEPVVEVPPAVEAESTAKIETPAEVTEEPLTPEPQAGTAESADLMNVEPAAEEDLKLEDLDLSDVKDIKEDEDKL